MRCRTFDVHFFSKPATILRPKNNLARMPPHPACGKDQRRLQNRRLSALDWDRIQRKKGCRRAATLPYPQFSKMFCLGSVTRFFGVVTGLLDRIIYLAGRGIHLFIDFCTHQDLIETHPNDALDLLPGTVHSPTGNT